jgi:hypothetical protein
MNRVTVCVLAAVGCAAAMASDIPPPRAVDVAALVRQLGSEDFAEREAATERLSTLKVDQVPPELLAALKSPSLEVRERAARAAKSLHERIELRKLPRGERFAKRGQIDLYIASTAASYPDAKNDDIRLWEPVLDIGRIAMKRAGPSTPHHGGVARCQDIAEYKKTWNAGFTRVTETYTKSRYTRPEAILAPSVAAQDSLNHHIVVSRGPVSTKGNIYASVILATDDVTTVYTIDNSLIICDGDVRVGHDAHKNLIIARGSISIKNYGSTNTLIAGGTVTVGKPWEPRAIPAVEPEIRKADEIALGVTKEREANPLSYITFFELHRIGLEVKAADGAVRVARLAPGDTCEKAGLKVGDTILEVNGKKPTDAESLRRLLRDALAVGDAAIKIQRGNDTLTLKVSLPE